MTEHVSIRITDPVPPGAVQIPRSGFLKRAALATGAVAGGGALLSGLPRLSAAPPSPTMDTEILNFFLLLERLQSAFYDEAVGGRALTGGMADYAEAVSEHEREHVEYLEGVLGGDAAAAPEFDFGDSTGSDSSFGPAALLIEETAAAAYIGQAANATRDTVLAAARIVAVDARHAAWMRDLLGRNPAPKVADAALSEREARSALRDEGFIA